ncbi:ABC transporter ATP-binding protein [Actinomadura viridis]|uniref:ABC-type sugar transport system ATPase subunit n=1 Tax=Actinomadura viridis TaxID=58110 RepID=A0A931GSC3_9ACTN|nr:ABC transporter ATP-binding protein [Actinomadura viridis]MBG6090664.1 ABC-type sugar transport system ATPase subunit [Actinomadura viridis]
MATLTLKGLRKTYGKVTALDGIDLEVADGEFFCLLGPSGAGKTTTLKAVAGLEPPDAGRVEIGGVDMDGVEPYDRGVAMCFESYALYPHYTAFDNMVSPLRSPRYRVPAAEARERVGRFAELLGISHLLDRGVGELSNGQRQRVALGRVLVRPARAFLLDEPLSHLDAKLRQSMRAELKTIGAVERTTTLYVTHDYVEALGLGDRIGVIRDGRIVQVGTREQIWNEPADTFVAHAFGKPRINLLPGEVAEGGRLRAAGGEIDLPSGGSGLAPGRAVTLGVRPRDLVLLRGAGDTAPEGMAEVRARVYVTEVLGRQSEVTVTVGDQRLALVVPREDAAGLAPETPVRLAVPGPDGPGGRTLLFDPADGGRRIA